MRKYRKSAILLGSLVAVLALTAAGSIGPRGPAGARGPRGFTGARGPAGPRGLPGLSAAPTYIYTAGPGLIDGCAVGSTCQISVNDPEVLKAGATYQVTEVIDALGSSAIDCGGGWIEYYSTPYWMSTYYVNGDAGEINLYCTGGANLSTVRLTFYVTAVRVVAVAS
jgi:hypothetical protein